MMSIVPTKKRVYSLAGGIPDEIWLKVQSFTEENHISLLRTCHRLYHFLKHGNRYFKYIENKKKKKFYYVEVRISTLFNGLFEVFVPIRCRKLAVSWQFHSPTPCKVIDPYEKIDLKYRCFHHLHVQNFCSQCEKMQSTRQKWKCLHRTHPAQHTINRYLKKGKSIGFCFMTGRYTFFGSEEKGNKPLHLRVENGKVTELIDKKMLWEEGIFCRDQDNYMQFNDVRLLQVVKKRGVPSEICVIHWCDRGKVYQVNLKHNLRSQWIKDGVEKHFAPYDNNQKRRVEQINYYKLGEKHGWCWHGNLFCGETLSRYEYGIKTQTLQREKRHSSGLLPWKWLEFASPETTRRHIELCVTRTHCEILDDKPLSCIIQNPYLHVEGKHNILSVNKTFQWRKRKGKEEEGKRASKRIKKEK